MFVCLAMLSLKVFVLIKASRIVFGYTSCGLRSVTLLVFSRLPWFGLGSPTSCGISDYLSGEVNWLISVEHMTAAFSCVF